MHAIGYDAIFNLWLLAGRSQVIADMHDMARGRQFFMKTIQAAEIAMALGPNPFAHITAFVIPQFPSL